jgi:23S rRNA (uracil1939-C5)-methyltransferase
MSLILNDLEIKLFSGRDSIYEELDGLKFKIGPKSFFQTNISQAEELYRIVLKFAEPSPDQLVYDLYTGTGTIANYIARYSKKVIGIESVEAAINDARINSQINNMKNMLFVAGDTRNLLNPDFFDTYGKPDIIITDPPRNGMHKKVIEAIVDCAPKRIVYVSCNPATQARDIQILSKCFKVIQVQPVDMFPHTHHVENVISLEHI